MLVYFEGPSRVSRDNPGKRELHPVECWGMEELHSFAPNSSAKKEGAKELRAKEWKDLVPRK